MVASERNTPPDSCPECGSDDIITEAGETHCQECGLVIDEDHIDRGPDWRSFDDEEESSSRVGPPSDVSVHDNNLTTTIDWKDTDAKGNSISSDKKNQLNRLRKWQKRIRVADAEERNLKFALSEIDRMGSALGVPRSVRETASVVYRSALNNDLIRGRSIEGASTAAIYIACRQEGIPRSLEEVSAVSRVGRTEIGRTYRYLSRELGLEMKPVNPKKFVPRYCTELELSTKVEKEAEKIIEETAEKLLSGRDPTAFAAGAIYIASMLHDEHKTQDEIAEAADVTEVTVRNRYQEQVEELGIFEGEYEI